MTQSMAPGTIPMKTNTAVTIFNRYYDPDLKVEVYQRTVIPAALWEDRKYSRAVGGGTRLADYSAMIFIPFSYSKASYLQPIPWLALADKSDNWTIQQGDFLVKGEVADELSSSFTPSDLKRKYDDVLEAIDIYTFDFGSYHLQHWKVMAK